MPVMPSGIQTRNGWEGICVPDTLFSVELRKSLIFFIDFLKYPFQILN